MARLDRLGDSKELAQIAACIGRDVDHRLLAAIAGRPEAELLEQVDELCAAGLLFRRGSPPDIVYSFKHALVRDVAYESLLKSRRRAIHAQVLDAIERGIVPAEPEQSASHAAAAEQWAKAIHYYGMAGKAALERASHTEGLDLIAKAIDAGRRLGGDATVEVTMIDLLRARAWAQLEIGDRPRMMSDLREAEARAGRLGVGRMSCQLHLQHAHVEYIFGGTTRRALSNAKAAMRLATGLRDAELAAAARFVLGYAHFVAGDYRAGAAELTVDLEAYRQHLRIAGVASGGLLAVEGLATLGSCLAQLGRWDEALAHGGEATALADDIGSPWDRNVANYHLARTQLLRGDVAAALPLVERSIANAVRCGLRMALPWQHALLGRALLRQGHLDDSVATLERAMADSVELNLMWTGTDALLAKAEACLAAGRDDAGEVANEALELARRHGYRAFEAGALRLQATAAQVTPDPSGLAEARMIAESLGLALELAAIDALTRSP